MRNITLFHNSNHDFILLNESEPGEEDGVRSNQFLVIHDGNAALLDPGGWGVMPRVLAEMLRYIQPEQLKAIVLSHQDPDIVGGLGTWLELAESKVYVANTWMRFLPHYGQMDIRRFVGIPDAGAVIHPAPNFELELLPAHFLHSPGQLNAYDPVANILFTGDVGAAMLPPEIDTPFVDDFDAHIPFIEGFHRRYMASNRALQIWVAMVERLDVDLIAPQHGPVYRGQAVADFLAWLKELQCGIDLMRLDGTFDHDQ